MNAATIIEALALPTSARVDQRVPKKLLVENGAPTAADKRKINDGIEELMWVAVLKPSTIGVPAYQDDVREYPEIAVLSLTLRPEAKSSRLIELVHRAVAYPIFLIVTQPLGATLSLAHLRWSQAQTAQTILEGSVVVADVSEEGQATTQDFLSSLKVAAQPRRDLHAFYQGWMERFEAHAAAAISGAYTLCESPAHYQIRRDALAECERLGSEIAGLRSRAVRETQINRRVDLNLEIKRLETAMAKCASSL